MILVLLAGSLAGAWWGAGLALAMDRRSLQRVIALLLVGMGLLLLEHVPEAQGLLLPRPVLEGVGVLAGLGIGAVAALMGVAGGELLVPTLTLLFGVGVKLAGSLSLVISLPTMLVGFFRYSRDRSFSVLARERRFFLSMALGSVAGAFSGFGACSGGGFAPSPFRYSFPLRGQALAAQGLKG